MGVKLSKDYMYRMELNSILQRSFFDVWKNRNDFRYLRDKNAMVFPDLDYLESYEDHAKHCDGCEQDQILRFAGSYISQYGRRLNSVKNASDLPHVLDNEQSYDQLKSTEELINSSNNLQYDSANFKYASIASLYPHGDELYTGGNSFDEDGNLYPIYNPLVWKKIKSELSNNLHVSADPNIKAYFGIESPAELRYFKKAYRISYENKVLDAAKKVYVLEIKLDQIARAIQEHQSKSKKAKSNAMLSRLQKREKSLQQDLRKPSADFEKVAQGRKKLNVEIDDFASSLKLGIEFDEKRILDMANGSLSTYEDSQESARIRMDDEYNKYLIKEHEAVIKNTVTWQMLARKKRK